jgi:hypothetical protein
MESLACIRNRFPTPGGGETVSTSLDRSIGLLNMPTYSNSLVNRLRFEAAGKVRRTMTLEIRTRAYL